MGNLLAKRPELGDQLSGTRELMDQAVSDCLVEGYEPLIDSLELPDPDDRHVLAAAIRSGAQLIVTVNLRDFPEDCLATWNIEAVHPDDFVQQQMDLHEGTIVAVAKRHRESLKNPPKPVAEYLQTLSAQGLVATADRLKAFKGLI